jgi:hypothetical protein
MFMTDSDAVSLIEGKFQAAVELLGRTGADQFQVRYCEEEEPTVWMSAAHWPEIEDIMPDHWDAAGGMSPWSSLLRLCEAAMNGGRCTHCNKMTSIDDQPYEEALGILTESFVCWYRYDPELKTFRRSCEGVS